MPANIRETKIGFGYKKQTDLATANAVGDIWSLTKTNAALTTVTLNTENDAAELGKGHEFATQTFKSHWDVSGSIEKYLSSEIAAWAFVFGLGGRVKSGTPPTITYTCTPQDPVTGGIELPAFSFIEAIRQGASAVLDRMAVGCVVEEFRITLGSGPGRANSRITVNFAGSGKLVEPSGITLPAGTAEHLLPGASAQVVINGVDYVTSRNLVSLELGFKNNLRLDSGFYPGSGIQDGAAIRGRLEFGDREASLKFVARFEHGSTELTKLRNQTTGTAVVSLQGDLISGSDYHSLEVTFHKVAFRTAVVGDTDGIVTVEVECHPLWDATNGLLTAVAKCSQDNIG
ncbi:MAG TPA: hypothetical protein PK157_21620 [Bryobacteraceae bacterium]|nr:hypothetical protein [Bryobacteraceae bacterium]